MKKQRTGFILGVGLIAAFSLGFTDGKKGEEESVNRPTFKEVREYIMKGEGLSYKEPDVGLLGPQMQRNYDVQYYRLDLVIDEQTETVGGNVAMAANSLVNGLSSVEIDFYDNMQVDSVKSGGQTLGFTHANDLLTVDLATPVNQGEPFLARTFYSGTPVSVGFGSFGFDQHDGNPIIWSLSEPDGARSWWPCNDDPSDKADSVDIYLTVTDNLVATSNGTMQSVVDNGNGTKTYYWKESYPITTYLVSVAISNYQTITDWYVSASGDSMEVTHYVYPESYNMALEDFNVTVPMIEYFSETFGEYPFFNEKYGHSEFPWGGAMEHQCNTSYGTWLITGQHWFDWVVAHELSHMWWGDMITCETWPDLWLNEGFASYSEALWAEHIGGFNGYVNYMIDLDNYFDSGNFPGPVYDPSQLFNETVYNKGAWVLHMLRHVLGDAAFFQALWEYGHNPDVLYGTATTDEFQSIVETSSGVDLDWFFQEWVYGENRPFYEYWWGYEQSGGDFLITVHIDQVQGNAPVFRMPIDIRFSPVSGDTIFTVIDSLANQDFSFTLPENPMSMDLDPFNWVLKHKRQIPPAGLGDGNGGIQTPRSLVLHQNSPNPFNPSTVIRYEIPEAFQGIETQLVIYDVRGRKIRELVSGPGIQGKNEVAWNGRDDRGEPVGSGLYLYRLTIGNRVETKRMLLLK